jgi:hypothetical protein
MSWQPLTAENLHTLLDASATRMSLPQRRLWEIIRIVPQKWASHPYGDLGGGFWAVALLGQTVIWYNDIEDGFNRSSYTVFGTIDTYWCNQDPLEIAVQHLLHAISTGSDHTACLGAPRSIS